MNDDELTESERQALDAWVPLRAPADFADRVLAAREHDSAPVAKRSRWPFIATGLGAAAAAAAVVFVMMRDPSQAARGELGATPVRTTRSLGDRAVAVAEPNATLAWRIDDDGNAVIDQREGDVFYRVEPGGSFVVHTPAGDVHVTGTCFRIEVREMNRTKQLLLSGTVGAAVAAAAVITVYEGRVVADSKTGQHTEVVAGTYARLDASGKVVAAPVARTTVDPWTPIDEANATREQLIARTAQQQLELRKLRARVAELEGGPAAGVEAEEGRAWYDSSPERLAAWVADCRVRADMPSFDRWQPMTSLAKNPRGLEPSELAAYNAVMTELQEQWKQLVRALYIEATGDAQGAETLSLEAMRGELEEKGGQGEHNTLLQTIARERAGLAQPPADLAKTSPFERFFRAQLALGDQTEQALAKRLGADRAKAIRGDAWDSRSTWAGCPE